MNNKPEEDIENSEDSMIGTLVFEHSSMCKMAQRNYGNSL